MYNSALAELTVPLLHTQYAVIVVIIDVMDIKWNLLILVIEISWEIISFHVVIWPILGTNLSF